MHSFPTRALARGFGALAMFALLAVVMVLVPHQAHAATGHGLSSSHMLGLAGVALGTAIMPAGGANVAQSPFAGLLPAELLGREFRPFFAPINWLALGAGVAGAGNLVVDSNHDVVIHRLAYMARDNAGGVVDRPLLPVTISLASGSWFTPSDATPVELEAIAGINRGAPELVLPIVVPAAETLTIQLVNGTAAVINVRLALIGFRSARRNR